MLADEIALRHADYVVTEAGFGSDLGAEKFFNIKCRVSGLVPNAAVVVATLRALKLHGGGGTVKPGRPLPASLTDPNRQALEKGLDNLAQHIANIRTYGVPVVVAVNAFPEDSGDELEWVRTRALDLGAAGASVSTHFQEGGKGASDLAQTVIRVADQPVRYTPLYKDTDTIKGKIHAIATSMYGAGQVAYDPQAERDIERATQLGFSHLPICMAKTPLSLSHDPLLKGRPTGFTIPIKEVRILSGAGFLTAVCSGMQLMPGLPKVPAGEGISLDHETGEIRGLR